MKKIAWIVIGCLCLGLVAYAFTGFGDSQVSAEVSKETKGSLVRIEGTQKIVISTDGKESSYPLAASVWVYRNMQKSTIADLKPGDTVDLILNSKEQAAYIKAADASSQQTGAGQPPAAQGTGPAPGTAPQAGQPPTPGDAAAAAPSESGGAPAPSAAPAAPAAAASSAANPPAAAAPHSATPAPQPNAAISAVSAARSIETLSLQWKSRELTLTVKQDLSAGQGKAGSELYVQTKERAVIHLTGASADSVIQMLTKGLPMEQQAFEQAVKQRIVSQFHLKEAAQEWKADVKWRDSLVPAVPAQKAKTDDHSNQRQVQQVSGWNNNPNYDGQNNNVQNDDGYDDRKGKDKNNGKNKEKDKGKGREGNDD